MNDAGLRKHLQELNFWALLKRLGPPPAEAKPRKAAPVVAAAGDGFSDSLFGDGTLFGSGGGGGDAEPAGITNSGPVLETSAGLPYRIVTTTEQLTELTDGLRKAGRFAFDTETDALGAMASNLVGLSFSWEAETGWYVPVAGQSTAPLLGREEVLAALKPILEDESIKKVGHNIKYDLLVMRMAGVTLRGIEVDTMMAAFLLDAGRNQYGIDSLAREMLAFQKIPTSDLIGKGVKQLSMAAIDVERVGRYAAEDADMR